MTVIPASPLKIEPDFVAVPVDLSRLGLPGYPHFGHGSYVPKSEFHVTLIGRGHQFVEKLVRSKGISIHEAAELSVDIFKKSAAGVSFSVRLKPRFLRIRKNYDQPEPHERRSIIALCCVEGSLDFYRTLSRLSEISVGSVPHHVTLYVADDRYSQRGISLVTIDELARYSSELNNADMLQSLAMIH